MASFKKLQATESFMLLPSKSKAQLYKRDKPDASQHDIDEYIKFTEHLRLTHPTALEQNLENLQQITMMSGLNLETAFLVASECGCIPITSSVAKANELNEVYGNDQGEFNKILTLFNGTNFKVIDDINPAAIFGMHNNDKFCKDASIFKYLSSIINKRKFRQLKTIPIIDKITTHLRHISDDFKLLEIAIQESSSKPINCSNYNLKIITSVPGAKLPGIDTLHKSKGRSTKFEYAPFAISFIKCQE